jgi:hypothetical protein
MRLSWSGWLVLPLLCSPGCESSQDCGPTSDWPTCNSDEQSGGEGEPTRPPGDDNDGDGLGIPTFRDGGAGAPRQDASVSVPVHGGEFGSGDAGTQDNLDGGLAGDAGDAGDAMTLDALDGSAPVDCTREPADAGACDGGNCGTPAVQLSLLCTVERCLAACLSGSADCTACQHEQCGAVVPSCSGLPRP